MDKMIGASFPFPVQTKESHMEPHSRSAATMTLEEGNDVMFSNVLARMKEEGLPDVCRTVGNIKLMEAEGTMRLWRALAEEQSTNVEVIKRAAPPRNQIRCVSS